MSLKCDYALNSALSSSLSSAFSSILLITHTFANGYVRKGKDSIYFVFVFNFSWLNQQQQQQVGSELKELMKFPKVPRLFKWSLHFDPVHVNLWSSPCRWQKAKPVISLFNWVASTHWPPGLCLHSLSGNMLHSSLPLSKARFSWDLIYSFHV